MLEINGVIYPYSCVIRTVSDLDLVDWLAKQPLFPKVFWQEKGTAKTYAAVGSLLSWQEAPDCSASTADVRVYGGKCFDKRVIADSTWQEFPKAQFWLPQYELVQTGKELVLIEHIVEGKHTEETQHVPQERGWEGWTSYQLTPSLDKWTQDVAHVLEHIQRGTLKKVVLARKWVGTSTTPLPYWDLLKALRRTTQRTTVFAFQFSADAFFFGATPETLFSREGRQVTVDTLAGTRKRGATSEEDLTLGEDLLHHPKDREEFGLVKQGIREMLASVSESLEWEHERDVLFKNTHVQHLYNRLRAELKPGVGDAKVLSLLHPTAALGGAPREKALEIMRCYEPFDRGWYGAPVGMLSPKHTAFAVAIRSALLTRCEAHLFSGVGLVEKSCPYKEWDELDQKIGPLLACFGHSTWRPHQFES